MIQGLQTDLGSSLLPPQPSSSLLEPLTAAEAGESSRALRAQFFPPLFFTSHPLCKTHSHPSFWTSSSLIFSSFKTPFSSVSLRPGLANSNLQKPRKQHKRINEPKINAGCGMGAAAPPLLPGCAPHKPSSKDHLIPQSRDETQIRTCKCSIFKCWQLIEFLNVM